MTVASLSPTPCTPADLRRFFVEAPTGPHYKALQQRVFLCQPFPHDIEIELKDKKITFSAVVLAVRSPYFERLFRSAGKEGCEIREKYHVGPEKPLIPLSEVASAVFEVWLKVMETGKAELSALSTEHYPGLVDFMGRTESIKPFISLNNLSRLPQEVLHRIVVVQLEQLPKDKLAAIAQGKAYPALKPIPFVLIKEIAQALLNPSS